MFVCLFDCRQDYCESNLSISLTLDVMIQPINGKNQLASGNDPVPDTDF